jgi:hypothetical protein
MSGGRLAGRFWSGRCSLALVIAATLLLAADRVGAAEARRRVEVQVVEVVAGRAYLEPGAEHQIRIGDTVQLGRSRYVVIASNQKHSVVQLARARLTRGQRGFVLVRATRAKALEKLAAPRPLERFAQQWRPPGLPAEEQPVRFVPLGPAPDARRNRALVAVDFQRIAPLSGPAYGISRQRLRAQLHAEGQQLPLRFDADAFLESWQAQDLAQRPQNASRPLLNVQQLEAGYRGDTLHGALGRLRHAAATTGLLDGARISAGLSDDWTLGAFGGTLPNPENGAPSTEAARFGADVAWQDEAAARTRASLTLQGSRYLGRLDEQRITGLLESYPDFGRLGAHTELSLFEPDNPWGAAAMELSAAGADASVRIDSLRLGALFDVRSPERSRWLAGFLPPEYFCAARPSAGATRAEPCAGTDRRYTAALDAAWEATFWTLAAGAHFSMTRPSAAEQSTAFASFRQREILNLLRFDAGLSVSRGSLLESAALDLGLGAATGDDVADVSLYYRPSLVRYRAGLDEFVEHGLGTRLWWALSDVLDLNGSLDLLTGRDADVFILQFGAAWRPRF